MGNRRKNRLVPCSSRASAAARNCAEKVARRESLSADSCAEGGEGSIGVGYVRVGPDKQIVAERERKAADIQLLERQRLRLLRHSEYPWLVYRRALRFPSLLAVSSRASFVGRSVDDGKVSAVVYDLW